MKEKEILGGLTKAGYDGIKLGGELAELTSDLLGIIVYISQTKSIYRNKNCL